MALIPYFTVCWHNTIRGFKDVKENKGTKPLNVYHKVRGWDNCFQSEKMPRRAY